LIAAVALFPEPMKSAGDTPASTAEASEMAYIELTELKGKIPDRELVAALDDNKDNVIDADVWAQIQADVQTEIDGTLGQRFAVPFVAPLPAVVKLAAKRFAIEAVYARRNLSGEKEPWVVDANAMRKTLAAIAHGDQPLAPTQKRAQPSAVAITEPARTHSDRPAI